MTTNNDSTRTEDMRPIIIDGYVCCPLCKQDTLRLAQDVTAYGRLQVVGDSIGVYDSEVDWESVTERRLLCLECQEYFDESSVA